MEFGPTPETAWRVTPELVDVSRGAQGARVIEVDAEPTRLRLDLAASVLIVVDMQALFCAGPDPRSGGPRPGAAPIEPLARLIPALRTARVPILWLNWGNRPDEANLPPGVRWSFNRGRTDGPTPFLTKGGADAEIVAGLEAAPGDLHVDKYRLSGFWDTPLDSILRQRACRTLLFAGVNLDQCVYHSLADASFLGYDCVLLEDCTATASPAACTEATLYNVQRCLGFVTRSAAVLEAVGAP
ncbi:MAG TPA: isochorismatase family cysteine hydrolase [Pseudomonadales bacterium]|nr:isochorismatase family cysteine hydrolase [Pseudomonadales bacterium]